MAEEKSSKRSRPMSDEDLIVGANLLEAVHNAIAEGLQETERWEKEREREILLAHKAQWEAKIAKATAQFEVQKLQAQVSLLQKFQAQVPCEEAKLLDLDGEQKRLQEEIKGKLAELNGVIVPAIDWDKWNIYYMK